MFLIIILRIRKYFFFYISTVAICRSNSAPIVQLLLQIQRISFFYLGHNRTLNPAFLTNLTVFLCRYQLQIIPFCSNHHTSRIFKSSIRHIRILADKFKIQINTAINLFQYHIIRHLSTCRCLILRTLRNNLKFFRWQRIQHHLLLTVPVKSAVNICSNDRILYIIPSVDHFYFCIFKLMVHHQPRLIISGELKIVFSVYDCSGRSIFFNKYRKDPCADH